MRVRPRGGGWMGGEEGNGVVAGHAVFSARSRCAFVMVVMVLVEGFVMVCCLCGHQSSR